MTSAIEDIKEIQKILQRRYPEVDADGDIARITLGAIAALDEAGNQEMAKNHAPLTGQTVKASSFADPVDVLAFKQCKARGLSDLYCFSKGDNGIGKWGQNCAQDIIPMAALPREVWQAAGKTGGAKLRVHYNDKIVDGILGDTMPSLANIHNGAGIDLNPAFAKALGLKPPFLVKGVSWTWI